LVSSGIIMAWAHCKGLQCACLCPYCTSVLCLFFILSVRVCRFCCYL